MSSRSSQIVAASMVNIAGNVVLSALKLTIGLMRFARPLVTEVTIKYDSIGLERDLIRN